METDPSESMTVTTGGGASWLLVQDTLPWGEPANQNAFGAAGVSYDQITSSQLASTTLSDYDGVVTPSVQSAAFYQNLNDNAAQIATFVAGGGLLVAHAAQFTSTGAATEYLPGCTGFEVDLNNEARIVDEDSPIVDGVSEPQLQGWGSTAHGFFTDLPLFSSTIIENGNDDPIYVTYPWGAGSVFATHMTLEWVNANGDRIIQNEVTLDPVASSDLVSGLVNVLTSPC